MLPVCPDLVRGQKGGGLCTNQYYILAEVETFPSLFKIHWKYTLMCPEEVRKPMKRLATLECIREAYQGAKVFYSLLSRP